MQLPPHFLLGSAIFFEHVTVRADDHGNCFGLQLMHDLIKYTRSQADLYSGSTVAFLWSSPHQFNGHDGLRRPEFDFAQRIAGDVTAPTYAELYAKKARTTTSSGLGS
jgi:hypothetical protein